MFRFQVYPSSLGMLGSGYFVCKSTPGDSASGYVPQELHTGGQGRACSIPITPALMQQRGVRRAPWPAAGDALTNVRARGRPEPQEVTASWRCCPWGGP